MDEFIREQIELLARDLVNEEIIDILITLLQVASAGYGHMPESLKDDAVLATVRGSRELFRCVAPPDSPPEVQQVMNQAALQTFDKWIARIEEHSF